MAETKQDRWRTKHRQQQMNTSMPSELLARFDAAATVLGHSRRSLLLALLEATASSAESTTKKGPMLKKLAPGTSIGVQVSLTR